MKVFHLGPATISDHSRTFWKARTGSAHQGFWDLEARGIHFQNDVVEGKQQRLRLDEVVWIEASSSSMIIRVGYSDSAIPIFSLSLSSVGWRWMECGILRLLERERV